MLNISNPNPKNKKRIQNIRISFNKVHINKTENSISINFSDDSTPSIAGGTILMEETKGR